MLISWRNTWRSLKSNSPAATFCRRSHQGQCCWSLHCHCLDQEVEIQQIGPCFLLRINEIVLGFWFWIKVGSALGIKTSKPKQQIIKSLKVIKVLTKFKKWQVDVDQKDLREEQLWVSSTATDAWFWSLLGCSGGSARRHWGSNWLGWWGQETKKHQVLAEVRMYVWSSEKSSG